MAISIPGSVRLKYKLTGLSRNLNYHANGEMTWLRDGNRYEASMVVSAFLALRMGKGQFRPRVSSSWLI